MELNSSNRCWLPVSTSNDDDERHNPPLPVGLRQHHSKETWSYDTLTNEWSQLADAPPKKRADRA